MEEMGAQNKHLSTEVQSLKDETKTREEKLLEALQENKSLKAREKEAGPTAVTAFKVSKEYKEELKDYGSLSFLEGIKDTHSRV